MSTTFDTAKLAELRARTDRQLIALINRMVEAGLRHAKPSPDSLASAERRVNAENAYRQAIRLLPLVYSLSQPERRHIQSKLRDLERALQGTKILAKPQVCTAQA